MQPEGINQKGRAGWMIWLCMLAALLYCLAVWVRLESIQQVGLQSDERLWISRSHEVLKRAESDLRHVTSHLPHPGVTAAAVMAAGHGAREKVNARLGCTDDPGCQYHVLDAGRISITLFVSLFVPVVFLGTVWLLGTGWAFVAAFLIAFDPRIIGYTRMAHIDGTLLLFVMFTILTYLYAVRKDSLLWHMGSGIGWGCCLLTKPTGALVLPILLLYRFFRWVVFRGSVPLVRWRDVWLLVLAHVVFVGCFTRLWDRHSAYISRLHVQSSLARSALQTGEAIQEYDWQLLIAALGFMCLLTALLFCWRKTGSKFCFHLSQLLGLAGTAGAVFCLWPVVVRNLILYWTWVGGLSGTKHEAFGKVLDETSAPGYLQVISFEMPELPLLLMLAGTVYVLVVFVQERTERSCALFALLIAFLCWVGFLSTSSKQALRYVLPVLPVIYILGLAVTRHVLSRAQSQFRTGIVVGVLLGLQLYAVYQWRPYLHIYFNQFGGGLAGAHERGRGYLFAGQIPAVEYLLTVAQQEERPLFITVGGDQKTLEGVLKKNWPRTLGELHFGQYPLSLADYGLLFNSHKQYLPGDYYPVIDTLRPEFSVPFQNVNLVEIYRLPAVSLEKPYVLELQNGHRMTGDLTRGSARSPELRVRVGVNPPGYMYFLEGVHLAAGEYGLTVRGRMEPFSDAVPLVRIELGRDCSRILYPKYADEDGLFSETVYCSLQEAGRLTPRLYWFGNATLTISGLSLANSR